MSKERIVVAMSGGVDSSTVAAMLVAEGYDRSDDADLHASQTTAPSGKVAAAAPWPVCADAQKVAHDLGIPHYLVNYQDVFKQHVIDNFVDEYVAGRTPIDSALDATSSSA